MRVLHVALAKKHHKGKSKKPKSNRSMFTSALMRHIAKNGPELMSDAFVAKDVDNFVMAFKKVYDGLVKDATPPEETE